MWNFKNAFERAPEFKKIFSKGLTELVDLKNTFSNFKKKNPKDSHNSWI